MTRRGTRKKPETPKPGAPAPAADRSPTSPWLIGGAALVAGVLIGALIANSGEDETDAPPDVGDEVRIASIQGEPVTAEEIFFALNQLQPSQRMPLERFVPVYLDRVLYAVEAARQGIGDENAIRMKLRFHERFLRWEAYMESLYPELTDRDLEQHYINTLDRWMIPASMKLRHIVVDDLAQAEEAGRRLAAGETFAEVAEAMSRDFDLLPEGSLIGQRITAEDTFIDGIGGQDPNLGRKLMLLDQGATTGPIEAARGFHWIQIAEKQESMPTPLENVEEAVRRELTEILFRAALRDTTARLKDRVRREGAFEVYEDALREAFATPAGVDLPPPPVPPGAGRRDPP